LINKRNLKSNSLYGKVPDFKDNSNLHPCYFHYTSLCYGEEFNLDCYIDYECTICVENASLVDGICQCNNGYSGIGYINCFENGKKK